MDVIVDTLSFRANFDSFKKLEDFLGFYPGDWCPGTRYNTNYLNSLYYEGIIIGYNGQAGWGYYVHMSGKGCRTFEDISGENFTWFKFISKLYFKVRDGSAAVTRLDLAVDSFDDTLNLQRIEKYKIAHKYLTRVSEKNIFLEKFGRECFYVGSPQSVTLLRIYNKKLERGYNPGDKEIEHWYRCELQLRDHHAQQVILEWGRAGHVGEIFAGHLIDHFQFLAKPNKRDGHQHLINPATWWANFVGNVEKIKWASKMGSEYNMTKLQKYAIGNAGSSVKTMIKAKNLTPEQLYDIYSDPGIKLREDQIAFIKSCRGEV